MKKTALLIMLVTVISKILGFGREITLSYFFGASNISDAYLIALTIPGVIFEFIGVGLTTAYIPMQSKIEKELGRKEADQHTSNLVNILMVLTVIIFIFGILFSEPITKLFASGFDSETLELAVVFTRISFMGIFFSVLFAVMTGYLQIKGKYLISALTGFPLNFLIILSIALSSKGNVFILVIGTVVASASQIAFMAPFMKKVGFEYKPVINFKSIHIKNMLLIAIPVIIGTSVNQINTLVNRTVATNVAVGGVSALNFSNRLIVFVQALFVTSFITVIYPMISKMAIEGEINRLKKTISESINSVLLFLLPITIGTMIFAEPIVRTLFGRGAFDEQAVSMTSQALFFYAIGLIGIGLREVLSRVFYSMQDTKTPMINATIGVVLNIILTIILSRSMGIGGLALATSITATFTTVLLSISLRKKIGPFGLKQSVVSCIKILFASFIMGLMAKLSFDILVTNLFGQEISLIVSIVIGVVIYFVAIYLLKVNDVEVVVNAIKKKLKISK